MRRFCPVQSDAGQADAAPIVIARQMVLMLERVEYRPMVKREARYVVSGFVPPAIQFPES
jgi:hypothetical protein